MLPRSRSSALRPPYLTLLFLWLLGGVGLCGLHRLATGRWKSGTLYLLTFGLFGAGQLVDWLRLGAWARELAAARASGCRR